MKKSISQNRILLFILFVLSTSMFAPIINPLVTAQENIKFEGTFSDEKWTIRLDNKTNSGIFLKVGDPSHKIGDRALTIISRIGVKTWSANVYDKNYKIMQNGRFVIEVNKLIITPDKGAAYVLLRIDDRKSIKTNISETQTVVRKPKSESLITTHRRSYSSGCATVQCHGTTKKGYRCSRSTTNCSGYCWQH